MTTGSLINEISGVAEMPDAQVGDGMTELCWTDRHAFTVIGRSASGKTLTVQQDTATRVDGNGMSESQDYAYTPNPDGRKYTVRWSPKRHAFVAGDVRFVPGRREYYDFSF